MSSQDIKTMITRGRDMLRARRQEEARAVFEEATRVAEREHGPMSAEVIEALIEWLHSLSHYQNVAKQRALSSASHEIEQRICDTLEKTTLVGEMLRIRAWSEVASCAGPYGRHDDAIRCGEKALGLRRAAGCDRDRLALSDRLSLIAAFNQSGRPERSIEHCDDGIVIARSDPALDRYVGGFLVTKGTTLLLRGAFESAIAALDEAAKLPLDPYLTAELTRCRELAEQQTHCILDQDGTLVTSPATTKQ